MEDESLEKKQLFLRTEILMNGYDAQEFSTFLSEYKGEEKVDLEYWTMEELSKAVESFKNSKILKVEEEQAEKDNENEMEEEDNKDSNKKEDKKQKFKFLKNILKRRQSSVDQSRKTLNYKLEKNDKDNDEKNKSKKDLIKVVESKNLDNIRKIYTEQNIIERDDIPSDGDVDNENEDDNIIKCKKLDKNELTDNNELVVVISSSTTIKKNKFLKTTLFKIETNPVGFKATRYLNDFEYLYEKIHLINPKIFNPILSLEKKDFTGNVYILNYYINTLIKSAYFRSLPIVYDFLTLPFEDWEQIKAQKYDKIKELCPIKKIQNLEGYFNLEIKNFNEEKYLKIKNNINSRAEAFNKFNNSINELINMMEKISTIILNLSESLCDLKNKHMDNKISMNYLAHLEIMMKEWGEGYITQRNYLNDFLKYIFKYMDKENNAFLKYYDNLKKDYDDLKSKMDKMKKYTNLSEKDKKILKHITKESLLDKINIYEEYLTLNEIQGERLEKLLIKFGANKEVVFSDINSFYELVNVFNAKSIEEQQKKEKKLNKDNKNQ
jgi:hypothetical protein